MKNTLLPLVFLLISAGGLGGAGCAGPSGEFPGPESPAASGSNSPAAHEQPGQEVSGGLSLADAVTMALRLNVDLRVESLSSALTEQDVARSRAIYDPVLTAALTGAQRTEPHESGTDKTAGGAVGVTQLLPTGATVATTAQSGVTQNVLQFPGSRAWNQASSVGVVVTQPLLKNAGKTVTEGNIVLAQNAYRDSLERYRFVAVDAILAVVMTYNRLYSLRQTMAFKKTAWEDARRLLETTKSGVAGGTLKPIDVSNAEYGVAQRLKDLVDAERAVRDQEAALRYLIGGGGREELIPTDPPTREDPGESRDQALKIAMESRSDLQQLRSALQSAELQSRIAKRQTLPDVSVVLGAGLAGVDGNLSDNLHQMGNGKGYWSAGVQLTVPLGNRAAESDYRKGKIREEQTRAQIEALSWRIRNDIDSDLRALISARIQLQVSDKALEQASQRLEEHRKNNQSGASTTQDVLNAGNDLIAAQSAHMDALESYGNAVVKLWRDTGELPARLGAKIAASGAEGPSAATEGKSDG